MESWAVEAARAPVVIIRLQLKNGNDRVEQLSKPPGPPPGFLDQEPFSISVKDYGVWFHTIDRGWDVIPNELLTSWEAFAM